MHSLRRLNSSKLIITSEIQIQKQKNCIWCEYCEDRTCCFSKDDYTKCKLMDFKRTDENDPSYIYYEYNFETVLDSNVCDRFEKKNLNL